MMRNCLFVLFAVFLLTSCVGKTTITSDTTNKPITEESAPLIIGGKQYMGYLGNIVEIKRHGITTWGFPDDPVYCTIEDIDRLFTVDLRVDPGNPEHMGSLENLELLVNLRELRIFESNLDAVDLSPLAFLTNLTRLTISDTNFGSVDLNPLVFLTNLKRLSIYDGANLASVDLSPLSSLLNLEELFIDGNISKMPDLTSLDKLKFINIEDSNLESLDGLGAPALEHLYIRMETFETLAPLSNLPELGLLDIGARRAGSFPSIGGLTNVPRLDFLRIGTNGPLDITGIERLTGLAHLSFETYTDLVNPQGISRLHKLETLSMTLADETPSIEYLRGLQSLKWLYLDGDSFWRNKSKEPYQVLDVIPLANNNNLQLLSMRYLIIKNIASLDNLNNLELGRIDLIASRLFNENEKSVHYLMFNVEE